MSVRKYVAEVAFGADIDLGEGPVWDDRTQELLFVDIDRCQVHAHHVESGAHHSFDVGRPVGAVVLREDVGLVIAAYDAFFLAEHDGRGLERFGPFAVGDDRVRFNDGKVDPAGRFVAGTLHLNHTDACGSLYMLGGNGTVETLLTGVTISNGLAWSSDGRTLYYIDTPVHSVDAFDVDPDTGALSGRRVVAEIPEGSPDGMAIDDEGLLWVAVWGGYRVDRVDPLTGRVVAEVRVPTRQTSSVAFGGESLDQLFITTAASDPSAGVPPGEPHAGDVFVVEPGVCGPAPHRFKLAAPDIG